MFKKLCLSAILVPSVLFAQNVQAGGASITPVQIPQTNAPIKAVVTASNQLLEFVYAVNTLASNNYILTLPGTTDTIAVSPQQQADIVTQYQTLKAALVAAVNQLP